MVTRQGRNYLWIIKRYTTRVLSAWRKISLCYSYFTLFVGGYWKTCYCLEFCYRGTPHHCCSQCGLRTSSKTSPDTVWKMRTLRPTSNLLHHISWTRPARVLSSSKPEMHCLEQRPRGNPPMAETPPRPPTLETHPPSALHNHWPRRKLKRHGKIKVYMQYETWGGRLESKSNPIS